MRFSWLTLICVVTACSDAEPRAVQKASESPSLEQAGVFPTISTAPPDSWLLRQMAGRNGVDYTAVLKTMRPVSHHHYLYERRRAGNWIAEVWRRGDGTREEISYFNTKTGALVSVQRDDAGHIVGVTIEQRDDYSFDRREPTGAHAVHLGERCEVWRSQAPGPGIHVLYESCVTDDGIELWSRAFSSNGQGLSSPVTVSSLSRERVDPILAHPPRDVFDWAYWHARASDAGAGTDVPPDHSVWFEETRTHERGFVIAAQYRQNWRAERSHRWYQTNSSWHAYHLQAPGMNLHASFVVGPSTQRSLSISVGTTLLGWRPDPQRTERDAEAQTVLGHRCHWIRLRNPPSDASSQECWTDDNLVLARQQSGRGGGYTVAAVRLDKTPPSGPIEPPPEIFAWARAMTN